MSVFFARCAFSMCVSVQLSSRFSFHESASVLQSLCVCVHFVYSHGHVCFLSFFIPCLSLFVTLSFFFPLSQASAHHVSCPVSPSTLFLLKTPVFLFCFVLFSLHLKNTSILFFLQLLTCNTPCKLINVLCQRVWDFTRILTI